MFTKYMTILVLALFSLVVQADICDDISVLANEWNEVANFVDENQEDDEISDQDIKILQKYLADLANDTNGLADALIELGNQKETKLGRSMHKVMGRLEASEGQDGIVSYIDKLVDILDQTTDYCDE